MADMFKGKVVFVLMVTALLVGAGAGYMINSGSVDSGDQNEDYWFYLYFSDGDSRNGWYVSEASNTNDGFAGAVESAGLDWTKSNYGYIGTIGGEGELYGWYLCQYLYSDCSPVAASNSILAPVTGGGGMGSLTCSNGWAMMSGYDDGGFKLSQFSSHIYFMSVWYASGSNYFADSPVTVTSWMNSGPFAV